MTIKESTAVRVVLVVEDEPLIRMNTADVCLDAGYEVLEAANADEALVLLQARSDIELIITDVDMPGSMDGLAMAHKVRDMMPSIALILASGKAFPHSSALPVGAMFFSKPFQGSDILDAMGALLSGSRAHLRPLRDQA